MANASLSLNQLSSQASMYVQLGVPNQLPNYVRLDRGVEWHVSALLSTAIETMTLSSRLWLEGRRQGSLSDMEAALNVNGNQRISELQCSILDPKTINRMSSRPGGQASHTAALSQESRTMYREDEVRERARMELDMSLSDTGEDASSLSSRDRQSKKTHIFGAVTCRRAPNVDEEENAEVERYDDGEIGYTRKRARFSNKPVLER